MSPSGRRHRRTVARGGAAMAWRYSPTGTWPSSPTRTLDLRHPGASLDFLGYTFRQDRDQYGRPQRYWNLVPSRKTMARERDTLRGLINPHQSHTPLPELIGRVNRHLRGWANYFGLGYPRRTFRHLNHFVRYRLGRHLRRRSQRGWRARAGVRERVADHHPGAAPGPVHARWPESFSGRRGETNGTCRPRGARSPRNCVRGNDGRTPA